MKLKLLGLAIVVLSFGAVGHTVELKPQPRVQEFSVKMFQGVFKKNNSESRNILFSPLSEDLAMALAALGSAGATEKEVAQIYGFANAKEIAEYFKGVSDQVRKEGASEKFRLDIANRMFVQNGFSILQNYLVDSKNYFGVEPETVDFKSAPKQAAININDWVARNTHDKIKNIVNEQMVRGVKVVLANALYMKAQWADPFEKISTYDDAFHLSAKKAVQVPVMHKTKSMRAFEGNGVTVVEMPYAQKAFSAWVVLPNKKTSLETFIEQLTAEQISTWADRLATKRVVLSLPKFKFETQIVLTDVLKSQGMNLICDPDRADLSRISEVKPGLYVSDVIQKTFIEVDELGTEAAAATVAMMRLGAMMPNEDKSLHVKVDRPFLFLIRHAPTQSLLFVGAVRKP